MTEIKKTPLIDIKLNSTNYNLWCFSIKIVLEDEEQHNPNGVVADGDCPWAVLDTPRAMRIIFHNCSIEIQATLTDCTTAGKMWNLLYRQHSGQNIARKNQGIKRLATFSYSKPTVQENLLELGNIITATTVAAGTESISIQELGVHMFLNALPSRFNSVRSLLEAREDGVTLEAVRKALIAEEERIKAREDHSLKFAGGVVKRCPHNRSVFRCWTCDPSKHPSKAVCQDCHKTGHFSKNSNRCAQHTAAAVIPPIGVAGSLKRPSENDAFGNLTPNFAPYTKTDVLNPNDLRQRQKSKALMSAQTTNVQEPDVFVLDSGCTQSILMNKTNLLNYRAHYAEFQSADYGRIICEGIGDLKVNNHLTITDCLYSPGISMNLISESQLCKLGFTTQTSKMSKVVRSKRQSILTATIRDGLYIFHIKLQRALATSHIRTQIFHRRMGHLNLQSLRLLSHISDGMVLDKDPQELCPICAQAKAHKRPFPSSTSLAKRIGELTHADICHIGVEGLMGKCKMFLLLVDDATRWMTLYPIQHKDDSEDIIKSYDKGIFIKTGRHLGTFRSDNGGEFVNAGLDEYFRSNGTVQQLSTPYNPQQNGRAERPNRTILEGISAMLLDAALPWEYWAFAAECFVYLKNRSPHKSLHKSTPYHEWFAEVPDLTNVRVFGFPCYVYIPSEVRKRTGQGHKLLPKSVRMIMVGYSDRQKAWKCYNPVTKQLLNSAHVDFNDELKPWDFGNEALPNHPLLEFSAPLNKLDQGEVFANDQAARPDAAPPAPALEAGEAPINDFVMEDAESHHSSDSESQSAEAEQDDEVPNGNEKANEPEGPAASVIHGKPDCVANVLSEGEDNESPEEGCQLDQVYKIPIYGKFKYVNAESHKTKWDRDLDNLPAKRTRTTIQPENRTESETALGCILATSQEEEESESPSYRQAMSSPSRAKWESAMASEYASLQENQVFSQPCTLPKGFKTLDTKMVLKLKEPEGQNTPRRYKARLCARGFKQEEGVDFDFTFAPVAAYNSLRLFMTILASLDYEIHTVDVKTAFLHSVLKEEIYIDIPDGYPNANALRSQGKVLKLLKCLYGLKQSPREWNNDLDQFLRSLKFEPCQSEPCVYVNVQSSQYLLVYVDDIIIGTKTLREMSILKELLHKQFPISDKGEISVFLNMSFRRDRAKRIVYLAQPSKIDKLLNNSLLNSEELRIIRTPTRLPACPNTRLSLAMCPETEEEKAFMVSKPYRSLLGQVLFIAITCRPDIATAVSNCGKYCQNPGMEHWNALLKIIAYVISTKDLALQLGGPCRAVTLFAYSDADWAGELDKRRSRTGYLLTLNGSPIIWTSKLQLSAALSSTEAEYVALSLCSRDVLWARSLLDQMGFRQSAPTVVYEDNGSAIKIAEARKQLPGVKHVEVRYHFIRDQIQLKNIILVQMSTHDMIADTLTKALPLAPFQKHREALRLYEA